MSKSTFFRFISDSDNSTQSSQRKALEPNAVLTLSIINDWISKSADPIFHYSLARVNTEKWDYFYFWEWQARARPVTYRPVRLNKLSDWRVTPGQPVVQIKAIQQFIPDRSREKGRAVGCNFIVSRPQRKYLKSTLPTNRVLAEAGPSVGDLTGSIQSTHIDQPVH